MAGLNESAHKLLDLPEAAARVPDGGTVALGGLSMNGAPMALVRELIRQGKRDLTVLAIVSGMAVDWLIAAGCVRRVISGLVSFEGMGLAPHFRRAVESGEVELEEYSEYLLIARLRAAAWGLPFMPTKAGLGTDVVGLHPETTRLETDPATGAAYVACTPLPVDLALVHAHAADAHGNVRVDPKLVWMDNEIVDAAAHTIVSVEKIVPTAEFTAAPHRTTWPRFLTTAVTEVPWGAYPTSCFPVYGHDRDFYEAYIAATAEAGQFRSFWDARVAGPVSHAAFIERNGGTATMRRIARREA